MVKNYLEKVIYAVAGPTASGKTALGVTLARAIDGEVVNFDSVQIYNGIQIATAKPTEDEKQGIPHHLIDYVDPCIKYTAADWAEDAKAKIAEIEARGKTVILVGGTGFYLRALQNPLFECPPTDAKLRARLGAIHGLRGPEFLHRMLRRVDPASAAGFYPRDYVRVMRALEFYFQTGARISEKKLERGPAPEFADRIQLFVLNPPRGELYERINRRTDAHFAAGLIDEVRKLRDAGVPDDTNALGAHGYRRVCEYLRGERILESAVEQTKQDVRNYAKRQLSWFRREKSAIWINEFGTDGNIVEKILHYSALEA